MRERYRYTDEPFRMPPKDVAEMRERARECERRAMVRDLNELSMAVLRIKEMRLVAEVTLWTIALEMLELAGDITAGQRGVGTQLAEGGWHGTLDELVATSRVVTDGDTS